MKFYHTTLENGLTVIAEQRESAVSVAMGFFVRTGARDETLQEAGVSHFLEHMMFKGTEKRSALDITYQLGAIGAQANAYTSEENTVFYVAVLPEYFDAAFELLSDMLRPSLDPEEFEVEKKVILEEIALYQDRPTHVLFETSMREFFGAHPAGNSVLGTTDSVGGLSREQMKSYFDSRYTAGNVVLAVAGCFDWNHVVQLAKEYCLHWPGGEVERDRALHTPEERSRVITKADLQRAHLCVMAAGPAAKERQRYPAEVLSCILGDASGSRTFWQLVDKGLADSAVIDIDDMDETGIVYGYLSSSQERIEEVGEVLVEIMKTPRDFGEPELGRAITKLGTRLVLQGESSMRRLMAIGIDWVYRKEYVTLQEELGRIKSVTRDDIYDMLTRYSFDPVTRVKLIAE